MLKKMKVGREKIHKLKKPGNLKAIKEKYNELAKENPSSPTIASAPALAINIHFGKKEDKLEDKKESKDEKLPEKRQKNS